MLLVGSFIHQQRVCGFYIFLTTLDFFIFEYFNRLVIYDLQT